MANLHELGSYVGHRANSELPSPSTERLKHDQDEIDGHLDVLLAKIQRLRTLRNNNALINTKLPSEILSRVFYCAKPSYDPAGHAYFENSDTQLLGWIKSISHVCSHWRLAALSQPSLWVGELPKQIELIQLFLERSKALPIVLGWDITAFMVLHTHAYTIISPHFQRTGALYLRLSLSEPKLMDILDANMPHLKVLDLQLDLEDASAQDVHPVFAPRPTTQIQSLILGFVIFDWRYVEMPNLTVLKLIRIPTMNLNASATVQQILNVLKLSPRLQVLDLRNVTSHDDDRNQSIDASGLRLPELRYLSLLLKETLLTRALLTPEVLPNLETICCVSGTDDEPTLVSLFVSFARVMKRRPFLYISVSVVYRDEQGGSMEVRACDIDAKESMFGVMWDNGRDFDLAGDILLCMEELDLEPLIEFQCIMARSCSKAWWRRMLGRAINLTTLRTDALISPDGLISALTPECAEKTAISGSHWHVGASGLGGQNSTDGALNNDDNQCPSIFLPSLSNLTFYEPNLVPNVSRNGTRHSTQYENGSLEHLTYCLKRRVEDDFMLNTLLLTGLVDSERELSTSFLENYVEHLKFEDGIYDTAQYEDDEAWDEMEYELDFPEI